MGLELPTKRLLFCVIDGAGFADDGDLDLTGVGHLVLDLTREVEAEFRSIHVVDLVSTYDDTQLAACLDSVGLDNSGVGHGHLLELLEAVNVGLDDLAAGTGAGTADGIANLDDGGDEVVHLSLVMVSTDSVADVGVLLVLLGELHAEDCVRELGVGLRHLADIVEQAGTFGELGVEAQLGSHRSGEVGHFAGVLKEVLTVGGTILHAADHAHELMVHIVDAEVDTGAFAHFGNLLFNLTAGLGNDLFDTCRMDTAIGDELVEREASNLAADGVEAAEDDGVGGVVDDDLHTGEGFEGADVAAFAADDAAFDLFVFEVEHADGVLDSVLSSGALDGLDDNLLGLLVGSDLGLFDDIHDAVGSLGSGFVGHHFDEVLLGFVGAHAGDVLKLLDAFGIDFFHFSLTLAELLYAAVEVLGGLLELAALLLEVFNTLVERLFALLELLLLFADLTVLLVDLLVVLALELEELLLGLENLVLLDNLALFFGVLEHLLAFGKELVAERANGEPYAHAAAYNNSDDDTYYNIHNVMCGVFLGELRDAEGAVP